MGEQGTVPLSVLHPQGGWRAALRGPACLQPAWVVLQPWDSQQLTHSDNSVYPFPPYTLEKKADLGLEQAGFISAVFSTSDLLKEETYFCMRLLFALCILNPGMSMRGTIMEI